MMSVSNFTQNHIWSVYLKHLYWYMFVVEQLVKIKKKIEGYIKPNYIYKKIKISHPALPSVFTVAVQIFWFYPIIFWHVCGCVRFPPLSQYNSIHWHFCIDRTPSKSVLLSFVLLSEEIFILRWSVSRKLIYNKTVPETQW